MQKLKSLAQGHQQVSVQVRRGPIGREVTDPIALGQGYSEDEEVSILGGSQGVAK